MKTRRGPGRPRNPEADAAILAAAVELLIEGGTAAASIEQVAQRAGVTRATIYRRFTGRTELLIAAIEAAFGNPPEVPEIRDLDHMLTAWAHAASQPRQRRLLRRLYGSIDDYPEARQAWIDHQPQREQARRAALEKARDSGQLPADADVDIIGQVLTGAAWHHLSAYPDTTSASDIKQYLLAVLRQLGYRPRGSGT
jgi:AcrR family transcriptional regulator